MAVSVSCPHCNARFKASSSHIGKKGSCQRCGESFIVKPLSEKTGRDITPVPENAGQGADLFSSVEGTHESDSIESPVLVTHRSGEIAPAKKNTDARNFDSLEIIAALLGFFGLVIVLSTVAVVIHRVTTSENVIEATIVGFAGAAALLQVLLSRGLILLFLRIEENTHITAMSSQRSALASEELLKVHQETEN